MKTLAFDTSGSTQSVAVLIEGVVKSEIFHESLPSHTQHLLPSIEAALTQSQCSLSEMDLLAVTVGPGSFTGLRIGLSTAKALARAEDIPVAGVSTLRALAQPHLGYGTIIVSCLDARMGELYAGAYQKAAKGGAVENPLADQAIGVDALVQALSALPGEKLLVGSGVATYSELIKWIPGARSPSQPQAHWIKAPEVGRLGEGLFRQGLQDSGVSLKPRYLRVSTAEKLLSERKKAIVV